MQIANDSLHDYTHAHTHIHAHAGNYGPPPGFCWDQGCDDTPMQDDPLLDDYNVEERVNSMVGHVQWLASHQRETQHVLITVGSDFQYENANAWYKNLDKLIRHLNADGRVN